MDTEMTCYESFAEVTEDYFQNCHFGLDDLEYV